MGSIGRTSHTPSALLHTPPPQPPLEVVPEGAAGRLGAPPALPLFVIQNDAVCSLKCAVDTEDEARAATRFLVRSTDLDRFTLRLVRAHGFSTEPFPVFLYVRSLAVWTRRCLVRMQVETTTHFVLECVSCASAPAPAHHK